MPTRQQRGAALLLALVLVFFGSMAVLAAHSTAMPSRAHAERSTSETLARAREALLGRAVSDDNRPGSLPCPAIDESGQVALFIGDRCPSYTGRFPWKAMKTGELRDGDGELLWYVLAPELRDHQAAEPINSRSTTGLSVDGRGNIAALIIAPGTALQGQGGRPGKAAGDYLDDANADGNYAFISGPSSARFNDRVLAIDRDELFRLVGKRVLGELRGPDDQAPMPPNNGLRGYHIETGSFPWADGNGDGYGEAGTTSGRLPLLELSIPQWLLRNQWPALIDYRRSTGDTATMTLDKLQLELKPCPATPCP